MARQTLFVLGVFVAGALLAFMVTTEMFDMRIDSDDGSSFFILGTAIIGGVPAILAGLPSRAALAFLGAIAALLGLWGASVLSIPGDGAIGGFLVLAVDFALVLYGLAIIGLRKLIIKKPVTENDL